MQYRAMYRVLIVPYVLRKYNKRNGTAILPSTLSLIISLYKCNSGRGCTADEIFCMLQDNLRTQSRRTIKQKLTYLENLGMVVRITEKNPARYRLTIAGINFLSEIERQLRKARPPKPKQ